MTKNYFASRLLRWFDVHGRHTLPWQKNKTLYRVWVSEIMLQQTQVKTVIPYYQRFIHRFSTVKSLADAKLDDVLAHWAGLGYYARGRNLHKAANLVMSKHNGRFPVSLEEVNALPGIGLSTAGAILSLSLNQRHTLLDGNVKRTLCRYHGITEHPGTKSIENRLWQLAEQHTPNDRNADYSQAVMDFGALLCTRNKPNCGECPFSGDCFAYQNDRVSIIPGPKPKKNKPQKQLTMLVLLDEQDRVTLFKRPPTGIWGGLYSLPEFENKSSCLSVLEQIDQKATNNIRVGKTIPHSFTHFNLFITPVFHFISGAQQGLVIKQLASQPGLGVLVQNLKLYSHNQVKHDQTIGLPAPILKIIGQLKETK